MANFVQLFLCYLSVHVLNLVCCEPFGEINFKNNFDIGFKPLPFKPIAFIKEKWSPFGTFGFKHGIAKRDLDSIKPIEAKKEGPIDRRLTRLPAEVYEIESPGPVSLPPPPIVPVFSAPIPAPPLGPVVLITPPPRIKEPPMKELRTDIYKDELINAYLKSVERPIYPEKVLPPLGNSIIPEKPKEIPVEKEEPNPFVKGSRLALYFGNILLEVLAQFIGGPRTEQQVPM